MPKQPRMPNMQQMLQQVQKMQQDMELAQEELTQRDRRGLGRRRHGDGEGQRRPAGHGVRIDPAAVDPEDVEMLADMVLAAVNEALRTAQELAERKMGGATGGLDLGRPRRPGPAGSVSTSYAPPVQRLVTELVEAARHRQPHRPAARVSHPARLRRGRAALAEAISEVKEKIGLCEVCFNLTDEPRCRICQDTRRDHGLICVVEEPSDVIPMERTHEYHGVYHVLGGACRRSTASTPRT